MRILFFARVNLAMHLGIGLCFSAEPAEIARMEGIGWSSEATLTRVEIALNKDVRYSVGRLSSPDRVYLDLDETISALPDRRFQVNDSSVDVIRIGSTNSSTRVVLELHPFTRCNVRVVDGNHRLVIELTQVSGPIIGQDQLAIQKPLPYTPSLLKPIPPPRPIKASSPITSSSAAAVQVPEKASLRIPRVSRPPSLDDFLRNRPREAETSVTGFRRRSPGDGGPISRDTTAHLSYDDQNIYVVWICQEDRASVRAHMAKRENVREDDQVSVYLDTFSDRRRAYVFSTNPLGVQRDGILTEGQGVDFNFDTLWQSQARLTADGFIVWMAIPFKSLRFTRDAKQSWAIALGRTIVHTSEEAYWPYISDRSEGFAQQMAALEGLERISPSHNVQFIPYGTFTRSRHLDRNVAGYRGSDRGRGGMDSKLVLKNAFTLDLTANPDFSEVESDDPQVLVNQRYEVFFPEKRPFFTENSSFFQTPENLFYSRRIVDPEFGGRLTGKEGPWALGILAADDRALGEQFPSNDPHRGRRAAIGAFRLQREIGHQSTIGVLATTRDFGSSFNHLVALDTRLKLTPTWVFTGQLIRSFDRQLDGTHRDGSDYLANLSRTGRHFLYSLSYIDRSPRFTAPLGFIQRVDIRQGNQYAGYYWKPNSGPVVDFGPSVNFFANWDHKGHLQDWAANVDFSLSLRGATKVQVSRLELYEFFRLQRLRQHDNQISFSTARWRWIGFSSTFNHGTGANYAPPAGIAPFVANTKNASVGVMLRPLPRLRFDQTYLFTHLGTRPGTPLGTSASAHILDNHITRSKLNYQFTRALSLRAILDYNSILPNSSLVFQGLTKHVTGDFLLTYLVNPGTAIYIGYNNQFENLRIEPGSPRMVVPTVFPGLSTGQQFFVKISYLFRE